MLPKLFTFTAHQGGYDQFIYVIASDIKDAWVHAITKALRSGPFALKSLEFIGESNLPKNVEKYADRWSL